MGIVNGSQGLGMGRMDECLGLVLQVTGGMVSNWCSRTSVKLVILL